MYAVRLDLRPAGALTLRRFPSSILHIATYDFVPPSTLAGFLRRLMMLRTGSYPDTALKQPPYYVLPWPRYHVLGAYPPKGDETRIHRTYRQGIRDFKHTAFSQLVRPHHKKQSLQLHTWEYLFVEKLHGYVLSEERARLEPLAELVNLGCKLGKEGYAFLEMLSEIRPLIRQRISAVPTTPALASEMKGEVADFVLVYRHEHAPDEEADDLTQEVPSKVDGFASLWLAQRREPLSLDYWTDGEWFFPAGFVEVV